MKLIDERIPEGVDVRPESEQLMNVICQRCGEWLGRVPTRPAEESADKEEVYAELKLLADEHRPLCMQENGE